MLTEWITIIIRQAGAMRRLIVKRDAGHGARPVLLGGFGGWPFAAKSLGLRAVVARFRRRITPSSSSRDTKAIPAAWRARRTRWRVSSRTLSGLDSRRLSPVRATRALSASISCVHPRSARAARTWREVIIHDHLQCRRGILHQNDYNSRLRLATVGKRNGSDRWPTVLHGRRGLATTVEHLTTEKDPIRGPSPRDLPNTSKDMSLCCLKVAGRI